MATAFMTTPRKRVYSNCFFCEERKRHYNVNDYKEGVIVTKIACLTGEDRADVLKYVSTTKAGLCKPCYEKFTKAYDLVVGLKQKIVSGESSSRYKRMAVSPVTPKKRPLKRAVSVKRTLVMAAESTSCCDLDITSNPPLPEADVVSSNDSLSSEQKADKRDHSYCQPQSEKSDDSKIDRTSIDFMRLSITKNNDPLIQEIVQQITSNKTIMQAVQTHILKEVDMHCSTMVSRNAALGSVLSRYRSVNNLNDFGDKLLLEIVREMSERLPFLLDLFTIIVTAGKEPTESKVVHVAAAYAILMNGRNDQLSAWHRMTTFIAIKGQLNDTALTRLNHLGLTLSTTSKLRLLDEAGSRLESRVALALKRNPIVKVTGDNLDIYVRTGHKSLEKSNQDLHLFASNIIFSRIVRPGLYSMVKPHCDLQRLTPDKFFPSEQDRESLKRSYCVILARILMEFKPFNWMCPVVPSHIYHPYQKQMSQQSEVFQLPIQMKNESKHEDCVDILDGYEDILTRIFNKAFVQHGVTITIMFPVIIL